MKYGLKAILINSVAIAITAVFLPSISYDNKITTLIFTATVLGIANTFIKPILSLILLPINVITLGLVGWFMNTILLFIVTLLVPTFNIIPFNMTWGNTTIYIPLIASYIITSIVLSVLAGFIRRIVD